LNYLLQFILVDPILPLVRKVVKALDTKISAGNLSRLLTSHDIADYDVAADALSWQTSLKNIRKFCTQYDMLSILSIPQGVDLSSPHFVINARIFKDAINNWKTLADSDYFKWQEFLLRYGSKEDTTSDNWLDDVLLLSMDSTLRAEVESDIFSIPIAQRGSITTLRCIIKRMVIKNQEARDALEKYIKDFDITTFPGENVPTACLRLKAVARALGNEDLPSNTIRKVLDGFAKSSTKSFNDFCSSQIALRRGGFYNDFVREQTIHTQLCNLLSDIEATYLDLVGGSKWDGLVPTPSQSSFPAIRSSDDDFADESEARALAAKTRLSWDDWVKQHAECHFCGKKGHIRPHCPEYLKKLASGEIQRSPRPNRQQSRPTNRSAPPPRRQPAFLQNPKAKAFLSAFNALFTDEDIDVDIDGGTVHENDDQNVDDNNGDDDDIYNFLTRVASLKE
jgi:hypothetical protein